MLSLAQGYGVVRNPLEKHSSLVWCCRVHKSCSFWDPASWAEAFFFLGLAVFPSVMDLIHVQDCESNGPSEAHGQPGLPLLKDRGTFLRSFR